MGEPWVPPRCKQPVIPGFARCSVRGYRPGDEPPSERLLPASGSAKVTDGLERLRSECRSKRGKDFLELPRTDREALVRDVGKQKWFEPVRELALGAYFSSETGMTKALRYVRVPGRYVGCMPLAPGQPAWG